MSLLLVSSAAWSHSGDAHLLNQLNRQLETNPDSQQTLIRRGSLFVRAKKFELAEQDFSDAKKFGDPAVVFLPLGISYYESSKFELAAEQFDRYLKRYPNNGAALEYRAKAAREMGLYSVALKYFKTFLKHSPYLNPGHFLTTAEIALIATANEQANIDAAISIIDSGIVHLGINPQLQQFAIELELKRNQVDSAIIRQQSLAISTGESPQWHLQMGTLLLIAGRNDDAALELEAASDKIKKKRRTPSLIQLKKQAEQLHLALKTKQP